MGRSVSKKAKKISSKRKIPKNLDIEELVDREERKMAQEEKKNAVNKQENKQIEFKETLKVEKSEQTSMNKKLQNVYARKDAQLAEKRRRDDMLNTIRRMEEQEEQR